MQRSVLKPLYIMVLGAILGIGCSGVENVTTAYENPDHVVTYRSNKVALNTEQRGRSLTVRAVTGCAELPCQVETVTLVFLARSDQKTYAENHELQVEAGSVRLEWPGPVYDSPDYRAHGRREEVSVTLTLADFRDLATAAEVMGRLGPVRWIMPYDQRAGLRQMVRQFE